MYSNINTVFYPTEAEYRRSLLGLSCCVVSRIEVRLLLSALRFPTNKVGCSSTFTWHSEHFSRRFIVFWFRYWHCFCCMKAASVHSGAFRVEIVSQVGRCMRPPVRAFPVSIRLSQVAPRHTIAPLSGVAPGIVRSYVISLTPSSWGFFALHLRQVCGESRRLEHGWAGKSRLWC